MIVLLDANKLQTVNDDPEYQWDAFETELQRQMLDWPVWRYAEAYDWAIATDCSDSIIEATRRLLYNELEGFKWHLPYNPGWSPGARPSSLQMTIRWAGTYACSYLNDGVKEDVVVNRIITDMNQEQRRLPRGIGEWIVEQVAQECDE